jgi:4-hydroxy-tetrahydrodipicolinate synthase
MQLAGIIPPIATPLDEDEKVDENALRSLVRYLLRSGVHGIFVLGSTGEFAHLSDDEKKR